MTLQQIYYALTIEECGSMNKASEKLFIVQPTLSSAIQELEQEIGITIFLRTNKGMKPTPEGTVFLKDMRSVYKHFRTVMKKYEGKHHERKQFGVSTLHYSFAVKAFAEIVNKYGTSQYDLAIRETQTRVVIDDVGTMRSEIGVIHINAISRNKILKIVSAQGVEFIPLITCKPHVYLWKGHPLAQSDSIGLEELTAYPLLRFEQNQEELPLAEEEFYETDSMHSVKVTDRSSMRNLMASTGGYTFGSGILFDEMDGQGGIVAVTLKDEHSEKNSPVEIGYLINRNSILSHIGVEYIEALKGYLGLFD